MMVPVKHEGRVVGVVQVMANSGSYTHEQLELVDGLVQQMAAAVRNARLQKEQRRLEAAEAAARAVAAEREQAAYVLDLVGDGIFLVDEAGIVRLWNRAAALVTGLAADERLRRPARPSRSRTGRRSSERIPVVGARRSRTRSATLPVARRRARPVAVVRRGARRRRHRLRVPRPDERAAARRGEERLHLDDLARAADADGRRVRRGADAARAARAT